jgi:flagellar biosynthesis/type III secretory pathway chaperone
MKEGRVKNQGRMTDGGRMGMVAEPDVSALLRVVAELTEVMRQENQFLRGGMPAALSGLAARKEQLTQRLVELGRWPAVPAGDIAEQEELRRHIAASGEALKSLTRENMKLLEAAMSASRRRIEAVMRAIHAHEGGHANGSGKSNGGGSAGNLRFSAFKIDV